MKSATQTLTKYTTHTNTVRYNEEGPSARENPLKSLYVNKALVGSATRIRVTIEVLASGPEDKE